MRRAVHCSRIWVEEKLLLAKRDRRCGVSDRLDDSERVLWLNRPACPYDLIFARSIR